ncbi:MAG: hypothetical protein FJ288_13220 [Planctomycetes bacterium]|nr:hypothetical protein [Planctomycetota bacterium]
MRNFARLAAAVAVAMAGCGGGAPDSASPRADAARVLDAVAAETGATLIEDVTWYESENLYEYVDGMAGYYVDSGFVLLAHSEWRAGGYAGEGYVELDLYDMGSPLGALDIMADARTPQTKYLDIGNECHETDDGLDVRAGRYFVKAVIRRDFAGKREFARSLAAATAAAAPPGPTDEALVAPLPAASMLPHSASYSTRGFLGRERLDKVSEASYEVQGKRVRLFIINAGDADKAKALLAEWKESLPPQPIGAAELPNTISYSEDYVGAVTATAHGKHLAGAIGEPAVARPLLASLLKRLE